MTYTEDTLALAELHLVQSQERIGRIEALIAADRKAGLPISEHESLLVNMRDTQNGFRRHRDEIARFLNINRACRA